MTSDSEFDLEGLKEAMTAATPKPDAGARAAHIALAQKNFDDLQGRAQGSKDAVRHTETQPKKGMISGVIDMFMNIGAKGGLAATTAIVAGGFLFFTPLGQDVMRPTAPMVPANFETELGTAVPDIVFGQDSAAAPQPTREALRVESLDVDSLSRAQEDLGAVAPSVAFDSESSTGGFATNIVEPPVIVVTPPAADTSVAPAPDTEAFANEDPSGVTITVQEPVSTFSIDVDTASYSIIRQSIMAGQLPPADAVRIEEMINYFPYDYTAPDRDGTQPFAPNVTVMQTPWNAGTQLVHIGLQGIEPASADRAPLNLVFLIDTSGSMNQPNKLPLLRQSFMLMLDQLRPEDEVAIVTYAGSAGVALPATPAADREAIAAALNTLQASGGTNGQGGLSRAYSLAKEMTEADEVSRVILATDGDFNLGLSSPAGLEEFIAGQRDSGIYLSVLGFGRGNLNDATMQALAQNGNGVAAYIDTLNEAQKVLVDQLSGALFAIAGDVKVQVEWNPGVIGEYRLIGYETRALRREDFNNDAVDAGELGAGHRVTAIYEVTPVGSPALLNDPLRYQPEVAASDTAELGFLRLRWKAPGEDESQLYEVPIVAGDATPSAEAQFATAVAGFGQLLRGSAYLGDWGWSDAIALANRGVGDDPFGYRREAVQLMRLAQSLSGE